MSEQEIAFHVGDSVVHWAYGLGEVIQMDEKAISGHTDKYYVVQIGDLTLWVPFNETGEPCLRYPTPAKDFQKLFRILSSPGESLSPDRFTRKTQLTELMKDRSLESICRVVRGLTDFQRTKKINENDRSVLDRASKFVLNEWSWALSIPIEQAKGELRELLDKAIV
jgi:RNA polymerase-interacting CarD/CdnL/TRCF family regulator